MVADETTKRVLVVSDDSRLSRAIELNLNSRLAVTVVIATTGLAEQRADRKQKDNPALIVVAMSSPSSEPVVALTRAGLTHHIGRVPILLISDRPVCPALDTKIGHLEYPFGIDALRDKVAEILEIE
jgi:DNA-binding response OmpR family regulator